MKVINYVKRRYDSTTSLGEAYHLFLIIAGLPDTIGTLDFWMEGMIKHHEYHVGLFGSEKLDQYLVTSDGKDDEVL